MPLSEKKLALTAIAALALAGGLACAWDLALIWDGGAQFCYTLFHGCGYGYAARFFTAILWQPVIWAAYCTDDLAILRALYGLPLCLAPAGSVALSWWMVARSRPALFPWALLGICAASAPVQVFAINESIFQLNVFWPVFLGLLVPLNAARWLVLATLLVFQFSHPQGLLLLGGATVALWLVRADPLYRRRAMIVAGVTMLCLLRVLLLPDAETAHQAKLDALDGAGKDFLYVNEMAPRVHNSGHWTQDGCDTSQFEQHIRAVAGWPLGSVKMTAPGAEMINLIGDDILAWETIAAEPGSALHHYGKKEARAGRKMGHVNRRLLKAP